MSQLRSVGAEPPTIGLLGRLRQMVWPGRKRWGLRTLGFLVLGMIALAVAALQGFHTLGTASCAAIGIIGATYTSVRGFRAMQNNDVVRRRRASRRDT